MKKTINAALAGNPNCGKSTIFNNLTGLRQHVGNWPGKTVEKKEGVLAYRGHNINIIDLPGTYSLTAYTEEEKVTRDYVTLEAPDVVIQILDSTNLERNLYLTMQLIELDLNLILAFNMSDLAEKKGINIDAKRISGLLNIPIVKTNAKKKTEINKLLETVVEISRKKSPRRIKMDYGEEIEEHICNLKDTIRKHSELGEIESRWLSVKLLENDELAEDKAALFENRKKIFFEAETIRKHLRTVYGKDPELIFTDIRYGFISGIIKEAVEKPESGKMTVSEKVDRIALGRMGIPIFLGMMFLMFHITFNAATPLVDVIDSFFSWLAGSASMLLLSANAPAWIISLISNGMISGVGSVLVFIPNIFILFFLISLLEDSGYLARAAFLMDRIMHKIGLHGKSFIPMILGFGCNVPAMMAARTLANRKERFLTIMLNPLMSCSARLPVYILFVSAFFSSNKALVIGTLYFTGIILALLVGKLFNRYLFKGLSSGFVMELPPYRIPTFRGGLIHMWERGRELIKKAGTIIVVFSIVIWFLANLPLGVEYASKKSIAGMIGSVIAPIFIPLGFGFWQAGVALIFGFVAKEAVVSTFSTLYGVENAGLIEILKQNFTPLSAYSFMLMVLIYIPCIASVAMIKKETESWKYAGIAVSYTLILAWIVSFIFYQGGLLLGFG